MDANGIYPTINAVFAEEDLDKTERNRSVPRDEGGFCMFKLHVYAVQADDGLRLGLIRDPRHLPDLLDEAGLENTSLLSSPCPVLGHGMK